MPKATKEVTKKNNEILDSKTTSVKKNTNKKSANINNSKSISSTSKKVASKKTPKNNVKTKSNTKKSSKANSTKKQKVKKIDLLEYYDLPYRYNQTVVKILAQTPKTLFVYWDISDEDRKNYIKQYGKNFFEDTKPVLIVHNNTMNYTFEIDINDFANCWYFNVNDEKCEYSVELGRRPKNNYQLENSNNYIPISSSNKIESPNGHILFEKDQKAIYYKNVKTNEIYSKDIANLKLIKYLGRIYNLKNIYTKIYKEDEFMQGPNNPTSNFK